jgi:hypothetical protein
MEERSARARGAAHTDHLKTARQKYKSYDESAATDWQRLKQANSKKALTPKLNAVEHAQWVHLSDIKQKKS